MKTKNELRLRRLLSAILPAKLRNFIVQQTGPIQHQLIGSCLSAEKLFGGAIPDHSTYSGRYSITIGILKDQASYYVYNIMACREMGVPFRVLDLEKSDWLKPILDASCDAFLAWPSSNLSIWKELYDERLPLLAKATGKPVVPSPKEIWLWESKRRTRDWLMAHKVPHPITEIFYDREQALIFADQCSLPVVLKTDHGAASKGIFVLRSRGELKQMVRKAFGAGILKKCGDKHDRSWGYVILQEFIPHDHEWRIVRIGDNYLCRRKIKRGDFASGSGCIDWAIPDSALLDFAKDVTDRGDFQSMALDIFLDTRISSAPRFLVNEMQCLVGAKPLSESPARGRWRQREGSWHFEPGDFYRNACANLRLSCLLQSLGVKTCNRS